MPQLSLFYDKIQLELDFFAGAGAGEKKPAPVGDLGVLRWQSCGNSFNFTFFKVKLSSFLFQN